MNCTILLLLFHEQETSHVRVITLPRARNFSSTSDLSKSMESDLRMNCTILLLLFHEQETSHVRVITLQTEEASIVRVITLLAVLKATTIRVITNAR